MRRPNADHLAEVWRVHEFATEFELLDVWRYPILASRDVPFSAFLRFRAEAQAELLSGGGPAAWLFALRGAMGRMFGWDDAKERGGKEAGFNVVYETETENLAEIQNATVHALMHLGRVETGDAAGTWSPQMAVYVKPRGMLGRSYMTLIGPFRHLVVYPALMRAAEKRWPKYAEARSWEKPTATYLG